MQTTPLLWVPESQHSGHAARHSNLMSLNPFIIWSTTPEPLPTGSSAHLKLENVRKILPCTPAVMRRGTLCLHRCDRLCVRIQASPCRIETE